MPRPPHRPTRLVSDLGSWHNTRIVICNWRDTSHPNTGGAEVYCERIAERFHELGAHVTVLTSRHALAPRSSRAPFGRIVRLGGAYSVYPLALAWLLLHRRHVDAVIDSENGIPFFSPLVLRPRTPVTLLIHHVHQQQFGLYFPPWMTVVGRVLENQVSAWVYGRRPVCVVSPSARAESRRQLSFRGPIFLTPCGQDVPMSEEPAERSCAPSVIYVGRLVRQKRLELLIEGFAAVVAAYPGAELHLVGDGEERASLEVLAQHLELSRHITFHGRVPDERRDALLRQSWLFVSPSRAEGWGMSVMEAAAHGVPAVSFRVPGLEDAIDEDRTGWLVEPDRDLGKAIVSALGELSESAAHEAWASRCRARAKRFTWRATADRLLGVLESERDRLMNPLLDRRDVSDAATLVTVSRSAFSLEMLKRLRRQDQARFLTSSVELLLVGTDEDGAQRALVRIGFPLDEVLEMRVARTADLIGWDLDAASARLGALAGPLSDLGVSDNRAIPLALSQTEARAVAVGGERRPVP